MSRDGFNSSDFRHIFEHSITVKDIAEPLVSFDHKKKAESIIRFMEDKQFDVVGVTQKGLVCGFALKTELAGGQLSKYQKRFEDSDLVGESEPVAGLVHKLKKSLGFLPLHLAEPGG